MITDDEMKVLEQFGTIKSKCWIGLGWDGISLNRLTTRSPYGDKKQKSVNAKKVYLINCIKIAQNV